MRGLGEVQSLSQILSHSGPRSWRGVGSAANVLRPLMDVSPVGSFDRLGFHRHALGFDPTDLEVDLYGLRCLVTGASAGLGYETARALAALGAGVVLACRDRARGRAALDSVRAATGSRRLELVRLDVASPASIEAAARRLRREPIDVLVHNAGVLPDERVETEDGLELAFATHVAGPHRLVHALRPALEAADGARVIWVSSGGMLTRRLEVADPQWRERSYDGLLAYAETKRAQVVLAELWAEVLAGTGICVNAMHPGWADTPGVRTSLPRFRRVTRAILRTPAEGADTIVWLAASPAAEGRSGGFWFDRQRVRTHWIPATRESAEERAALWRLCESLRERSRPVSEWDHRERP